MGENGILQTVKRLVAVIPIRVHAYPFAVDFRPCLCGVSPFSSV